VHGAHNSEHMSDASDFITLHGKTFSSGDHLCLRTVRGPVVGQFVGLTPRPFGAPLLLLEQAVVDTAEDGTSETRYRTVEVPQSGAYIREIDLPAREDTLLIACAALAQALPEFVRLSSGPLGVSALLSAPGGPLPDVLVTFHPETRRSTVTSEEHLRGVAAALAAELERRSLVPSGDPDAAQNGQDALLDVAARLSDDVEYDVEITTWTPTRTVVRVRARSERQAREKTQAMIEDPARDFRRDRSWTSDTAEVPITRVTDVRER